MNTELADKIEELRTMHQGVESWSVNELMKVLGIDSLSEYHGRNGVRHNCALIQGPLDGAQTMIEADQTTPPFGHPSSSRSV